MSFFRHTEIYRSDGRRWKRRKPAAVGFPAHRLDESPAGYSLAGCSPAEPASASPTGGYFVTMARRFATSISLLSLYHLISWSHFRGAPHFRYEEPFQRFFFAVWAKAVETAAWVSQRLVITGLKPRCELKGQTASVRRNRVAGQRRVRAARLRPLQVPRACRQCAPDHQKVE